MSFYHTILLLITVEEQNMFKNISTKVCLYILKNNNKLIKFDDKLLIKDSVNTQRYKQSLSLSCTEKIQCIN